MVNKALKKKRARKMSKSPVLLLPESCKKLPSSKQIAKPKLLSAPILVKELEFRAPSTFLSKHPQVEKFLETWEGSFQDFLDEDAGVFVNSPEFCDFSDEESNQIAELIKPSWSPTDEEIMLLTMKPGTDNTNVLAGLIDAFLQDIEDCVAPYGDFDVDNEEEFEQTKLSLEEFIQQDWPRKILEYALIKKMATFGVTRKTLSKDTVINLRLVRWYA